MKLLTSLSILTISLFANPQLPYPTNNQKLSVYDILKQNYFVNRHFAVKNYALIKKRRNITLIIRQIKNRPPTLNTLTAFINNDVRSNTISNQDIYIFKSGKLKGVGSFIAEYKNKNISEKYQIWLPALRKTRMFAEPRHDDLLGEIDFSFISDVKMRKIIGYKHKLIAKQKLNRTIHSMQLEKKYQNRYTRNLPKNTEKYKNKEVYIIKTYSKNPNNSWYHYSIQFIDTQTFVDYLTEYYKNGELIRTIERTWSPIKNIKDKRAQTWVTWYRVNKKTGHTSMTYIPPSVIKVNQKYPKNFWSLQTIKNK
jgi:hypothetical protein